MWTKLFWEQAAERAVKSAIQAGIGAGILDTTNILHVDWRLALGVLGGAALLSIATSIVSSGIGQKGSPSVVRAD